MINRRHFLEAASVRRAAFGLALLGSVFTTQSVSQAAEPAAAPAQASVSDRLNEPGAEARLLERRVGLWDVTETTWSAPGATPATTTGLVAERVMVGSLLQEFIRPPADKARLDVKRTDLMCYNRLDGRWDYVSFDTRAPIGIMPAWSSGRGDLDRIEISFMPFAVVGVGQGGTGQLLRMRQEIIAIDPDHDRKDQYFTLADGTSTEWIAHRYDYTRRP